MTADRGRRFAGAGVVVCLGLLTFGIHLVHALGEEETVWSITFGVVLPMLLSASLLIAGVSMVTDRMEGRLALRVAGWAVGGTAALSAMGGLTMLYQRAEGAALSHPEFVVASLATGGGVTGVLVGLYDAERIATEERLTREREKADRMGQQLAVLNRVLRHDIRNGVNVIAGFAELAQRNPAEASDHARRIERKASELQEMSENARRIETMLRGEGVIGSVDLVECVAASIERVRLDHPEASIEADLPEEATVSAHPLVDFAVDSVLENAIEHNDAPDPAASVDVSTTDDEFAVVRIVDDGPGIPEDELEVLESGHETQLQHASGLGLWLVNWIVTESDGEVEFDEGDARGSVVTIRLPIADESNTELSDGSDAA